MFNICLKSYTMNPFKTLYHRKFFFTIVRRILHRIVKWFSFEIISRRFVRLVSMFLVSDIFKGICLRQAYILSLDSHCLSLTTTQVFSSLATILSHRVFNTPWSLPVASNSVDWVSNKPAFLTLYISQLSFPLLPHLSLFPLFPSLSLSFFPVSPAVLYFLLTDDACLDQHSLRETYGGKDVFIEKLRRYRPGNLTVTMGNTRDEYVKRGFLRSVQSSYTLSPSLGTIRQIRIDINFEFKSSSWYFKYFIECDFIVALNYIVTIYLFIYLTERERQISLI